MICPQCKEQIEVGEASEPHDVGNGTMRQFHPGHWLLYQQHRITHYQKQLQLAEGAKGWGERTT